MSSQWQDIIANGKDSKYADWFHINTFPVSYTEEEGNFESLSEYVIEELTTFLVNDRGLQVSGTPGTRTPPEGNEFPADLP
jgi:hypothetical protein